MHLFWFKVQGIKLFFYTFLNVISLIGERYLIVGRPYLICYSFFLSFFVCLLSYHAGNSKAVPMWINLKPPKRERRIILSFFLSFFLTFCISNGWRLLPIIMALHNNNYSFFLSFFLSFLPSTSSTSQHGFYLWHFHIHFRRRFIYNRTQLPNILFKPH